MTDQHVTQPGSDERRLLNLVTALGRHFLEDGSPCFCSSWDAVYENGDVLHQPRCRSGRMALGFSGEARTSGCEAGPGCNGHAAPTQPEPSGEGLRAALVGLSRWDEKDGPCWCSTPASGINGYTHVKACRDARAAVAATPSPERQEQEAVRWDPNEEHCHKCGRPVAVIWTAPDDLWAEVMGTPGGIRCIRCFDEEAETRGHLLRWVPVDANLPLAALSQPEQPKGEPQG